MLRGFAENEVQFNSSDGTLLAANVYTPCIRVDIRGSEVEGTPQTDASLEGHVMVLVHAHPKLGGTPEMMVAIGWGQHT